MKKIARFLSSWNRKSVFFRIFIINIAIITLAISVTTMVTINGFSETVIDKEILLGEEAANKLQSFTEDKYNRAYNLYNYIHATSNVADTFSKIVRHDQSAYNYDTIRSIEAFLSGVIASDKDISEYILSTTTGVVYSRSNNNHTISPSFDYIDYPVVQYLLQSDNYMAVSFDASPAYILENQVPVVTFVGKIFDTSLFPKKEVVGIYIMNIPCSAFEGPYMDLADNLKGDLLLANSRNQILFSSNQDLIGTVYNEDAFTSDESSVYELSVGLSGLKVISITSQALLWSDIRQLRVQALLILIASIVVSSMIMIFIFWFFNKRMQSLVSFMDIVKSGDLNQRLPVNSDDEIGQLTKAFNDMCSQLDNYIKKNYYAEMKLRTSELNALQAQINPHFLYNTIESIRMKAIRDGNEDLAEMLLILGNIFRWSVRFNEKIVYIEDEVDYIGMYLRLQNFRLGDQINISIDVPNKYLNYGIPKLILQPIVENSILHSFLSKSKDSKLTIRAIETEGKMEITVIDNGLGMDQNRLHELITYMNKGGESIGYGIGLKNVHERLQLLFGPEYGLTIQSQLEQGTSVTVSFPARKKEEMLQNV